jgi:hypothetical protein
VFTASVRVSAPVLAIGNGGAGTGQGGAVTLWRGREVEPAGTIPAVRHEDRVGTGQSWAPLLAAADGVPAIGGARTSGTLADLATATAGFRDQYYGVLPFLRDAAAGADIVADAAEAIGPGWAPLVTSGTIGAARSFWGVAATVAGKRAWRAPVVDVAALAAADATLGSWTRARLRPKLVLAMQTAVGEAAVDHLGVWVPAVPTVSVEPADAADLWRLAALLNSPFAALWARHHLGGTGLSGGALRIPARTLTHLPLPAGEADWEEAAGSIAEAAAAGEERHWRAALRRSAAAVCAAYGIAAQPALAWWDQRLRAWPGPDGRRPRLPRPAG